MANTKRSTERQRRSYRKRPTHVHREVLPADSVLVKSEEPQICHHEGVPEGKEIAVTREDFMFITLWGIQKSGHKVISVFSSELPIGTLMTECTLGHMKLIRQATKEEFRENSPGGPMLADIFLATRRDGYDPHFYEMEPVMHEGVDEELLLAFKERVDAVLPDLFV